MASKYTEAIPLTCHMHRQVERSGQVVNIGTSALFTQYGSINK